MEKKGEHCDTLEGDPLDIIPEERLKELLSTGSVSTLRELCSKCGFPMPNENCMHRKIKNCVGKQYQFQQCMYAF